MQHRRIVKGINKNTQQSDKGHCEAFSKKLNLREDVTPQSYQVWQHAPHNRVFDAFHVQQKQRQTLTISFCKIFNACSFPKLAL